MSLTPGGPPFEPAVQWYLGKYNLGSVKWDLGTRAAYDGLAQRGPNLSSGSASTLASFATFQTARQRELVK
jgi:hypothetical protein